MQRFGCKHACRDLLREGAPVVRELHGLRSLDVALSARAPRFRLGHPQWLELAINPCAQRALRVKPDLRVLECQLLPTPLWMMQMEVYVYAQSWYAALEAAGPTLQLRRRAVLVYMLATQANVRTSTPDALCRITSKLEPNSISGKLGGLSSACSMRLRSSWPLMRPVAAVAVHPPFVNVCGGASDTARRSAGSQGGECRRCER